MSLSRKMLLELDPSVNFGSGAVGRASFRVWCLEPFTDGTTERHAVCKTLSTCSRLQKKPFMESRSIPTATPKTKPPAAATISIKAVVGPLLLNGGEAAARMRASEIGNDACCSDSA